MENVEGQSLQQMLKLKPNRRIVEEEAARIFMQIMNAMDYMHS